MKGIATNKTYYFVDESGDDVFFDKYGRNLVASGPASPVLMLGYIQLSDPKTVRRSVMKLRDEVKMDQYLASFPSWKKSVIAFHAKDDIPEIRERMYKLIKTLDFKAQVIVARKDENIFRKAHTGNADRFYQDLIAKLFKNRLHLDSDIAIYFSKRGNSTKQAKLEEALNTAKVLFEQQWNHKHDNSIMVHPAQRPSEEACLQVVDYVLWAVQRLFVKGDSKYFGFIQDKYSLVWDLYDYPNYKRKGGGTVYSSKNKLEVNKISPL